MTDHPTPSGTPSLREQLLQDTYQKLAGALEHDGDTAGYSFLPEDEGLQILRDFLATALAQAEQERDDWKHSATVHIEDADGLMVEVADLKAKLAQSEAERDRLKAIITELEAEMENWI